MNSVRVFGKWAAHPHPISLEVPTALVKPALKARIVWLRHRHSGFTDDKLSISTIFQWSVQKFCLRKYMESHLLSAYESWRLSREHPHSIRRREFKFTAQDNAVFSPALTLIKMRGCAVYAGLKMARCTSLPERFQTRNWICICVQHGLRSGPKSPNASVLERGASMGQTATAKSHRAMEMTAQSWRGVIHLNI